MVAQFTCNPFTIDYLTTVDDISISFSEEVSRSISDIETTGEEQFLQFWNNVLIKVKVPIDSTITSNNFKLPDKLYVKSSKKDPTLTAFMISKLRSAYRFRTHLAVSLFSSEIFGYAKSIASDSLTLYHGTKSDILKRMKLSSKWIIPNDKSSIVIELSPIIKAKSSPSCTTFSDFAAIVYRTILYHSKGYKGLDVVADRYFQDS